MSFLKSEMVVVNIIGKYLYTILYEYMYFMNHIQIPGFNFAVYHKYKN